MRHELIWSNYQIPYKSRLPTTYQFPHHQPTVNLLEISLQNLAWYHMVASYSVKGTHVCYSCIPKNYHHHPFSSAPHERPDCVWTFFASYGLHSTRTVYTCSVGIIHSLLRKLAKSSRSNLRQSTSRQGYHAIYCRLQTCPQYPSYDTQRILYLMVLFHSCD